MSTLKSKLIRLAYENPKARPKLLLLLKKGGKSDVPALLEPLEKYRFRLSDSDISSLVQKKWDEEIQPHIDKGVGIYSMFGDRESTKDFQKNPLFTEEALQEGKGPLGQASENYYSQLEDLVEAEYYAKALSKAGDKEEAKEWEKELSRLRKKIQPLKEALTSGDPSKSPYPGDLISFEKTISKAYLTEEQEKIAEKYSPKTKSRNENNRSDSKKRTEKEKKTRLQRPLPKSKEPSGKITKLPSSVHKDMGNKKFENPNRDGRSKEVTLSTLESYAQKGDPKAQEMLAKIHSQWKKNKRRITSSKPKVI